MSIMDATIPSPAILHEVHRKRSQVDQRLDALLLLQGHAPTNTNNNNNTNNGSQVSNSRLSASPMRHHQHQHQHHGHGYQQQHQQQQYISQPQKHACTSSCPPVCTDTFHRVDSSDWLESFGAFVPVNGSAKTSTAPSSKSNANFSYVAAPVASHQQQQQQTQQQQQQRARNVSTDDLFVVSDRLSAILPDLDLTNLSTEPTPLQMPSYDYPQAPPAQDINSSAANNAFAHFFNDTDAWLKPVQTPSQQQPPYYQHQHVQQQQQEMPALTHAISSGEVSRGSSQTSSPTPSLSGGASSPKAAPKKKKTTTKKRSSAASAASKRKLGRPSAFPQKLYTMLTELEASRTHLSDVVGFTEDGAAFQIYDSEAFATDILPQFFKMSSFSSFQRQLQLYNFKRISKGGPYAQSLFHRDQPDAVGQMARKQSRPSHQFATAGSSSTTTIMKA